jgi:hypothetical protein
MQPFIDKEDFVTRARELWFNRNSQPKTSFIALYFSLLSIGALVREWDEIRLDGLTRLEWSRKLFGEAQAHLNRLHYSNDLETVHCLFLMVRKALWAVPYVFTMLNAVIGQDLPKRTEFELSVTIPIQMNGVAAFVLCIIPTSLILYSDLYVFRTSHQDLSICWVQPRHSQPKNSKINMGFKDLVVSSHCYVFIGMQQCAHTFVIYRGLFSLEMSVCHRSNRSYLPSFPVFILS